MKKEIYADQGENISLLKRRSKENSREMKGMGEWGADRLHHFSSFISSPVILSRIIFFNLAPTGAAQIKG